MFFFFFQAEDGIRDLVRSRGLGDVYKRQTSFFTILVVGMLGGLGRISGNRIVRGVSSLYVEVVRGIPLLVWLLYIWFALPQVLQVLGKALQPIIPAAGNFISTLRIDPLSLIHISEPTRPY